MADDFKWADEIADEHMRQPGVAGMLGDAATLTGHAISGAASGLNPLHIPSAMWEVGKQAAGALSEGDAGGVIDALGMNPKEAQDRANAHAELAFGAGNHIEGAFHKLMGVLPFIGPAGDQAVTDLMEGIRNGDAGKIGDAVGNVGAIIAPEALRLTPKVPGATATAESLRAGAKENIMNTIRPIRPDNLAPAAERAAAEYVKSDIPWADKISMSRQSFIDKMKGGVVAAADASKQAVNFDTTGRIGPVQPLLQALDQYGRDNYTSPHASGGRVPINVNGLDAIKDLKDRVVAASGGNTPAPAILAPGQPPPLNSRVTTVPLEHTEKLRRNLEQGTLNTKGDWRTDLSPESVQIMDRAHAKVIREWQEQHAPDMQEGRNPTRMFAQLRDRAEEARNRVISGEPKDIPILGALKSGKMPSAIQNSMANIPWNTVAASTKAAAARAIQSGDWGRTTRILQLAKLGVPVPDDRDSNGLQ